MARFLRTDNQKKRISSVTFRKEVDTDPDLSWLGEYSNTPGEVYLDREEIGHRGRHEYRYFNMSENYKGETPENQNKYMIQDYERMEAYNRQDWCMYFLIAEAQVVINGIIQTVTSGGLGGVESDSGDEYFEEIKQEQLNELSGVLRQLGFRLKDITAAFKDVKEKDG